MAAPLPPFRAPFAQDDSEIAAQIATDYRELRIANCPHTATAMFVLRQLPVAQLDMHWIVVATAHAAKFESIVEPLIDRTLDLPDALAGILARESRFDRISPTVDALAQALDGRFRVDQPRHTSDK